MRKKIKNPRSKKMEKIQKQLNETIVNCVTNQEEYEKFLKYALNCKKYSVNNTAILYSRLENPCVKTALQWKEKGINVLNKDNPVFLLRPSPYEGFYKDKKWVPLVKAADEDKDKINKGEIKIYRGFNFSWFSVYDIKDTDASKEQILENREQVEEKFDLQSILVKKQITFSQFVDELKLKIKKMDKLKEFRDTYEASVLYCCGVLLGFNPMVNNYNLFTNADCEDIKVMTSIKKMLSSVVRDAQSIVDGFLLEGLA